MSYTPLELEITRQKDLVIVEVKNQDERLRGMLSVWYTPRFHIHSINSPQVGGNRLFIRGDNEIVDKNKRTGFFRTESDAIQWVKDCEEAVKELNSYYSNLYKNDSTELDTETIPEPKPDNSIKSLIKRTVKAFQ